MKHQYMTTMFKPAVKNLVSNGNFANGTTGWTIINSSIDNTDGMLQVTSTTTVTTGYAGQSVTFATNDKVYFRVKYELLTNLTAVNSYVGIRTWAASAGNVVFKTGVHPAGTTGTLSGIKTIVDGALYTQMLLSVYDTTIPVICKFDDAGCVNLTTLFGAGNEPTLAWCDANIAPFIVY